MAQQNMSSEQSNRLFVGNLAWATTDDSLRQAFTLAQVQPIEAKVIVDRYTGRSRGFGFVTFDSPDGASAAMEKMNGSEVDGRAVRVDFASSQRN